MANMERLANLVCLAYHEARYIRCPIEAGKLNTRSEYDRLRHIPEDRCAAWRCMSETRGRAALATSGQGVLQEFEEAYAIALSELAKLFAMPVWPKKLGGKKWANITTRVLDLATDIDRRDERVSEVYDEIFSMQHNSGSVGKKLSKLEIC